MLKIDPINLIIIHVFVSVVISLICSILLPSKVSKQAFLKNLLTIFLLIFLIPVIGYFLIPFLFLYLLRKEHIENIDYLKLPIKDITMEKIKAKPRKFGEAALTQLVKNKQINNENFIFIISNFIHPQTINAIKQALASSNDEVRLYAFSILAKSENEINEKVEMLKKQLEKATNNEEKGTIYFELANLYWDMYYLGLVDKELEDFVLKETETFIHRALNYTENPEINFLAGKIYLKKLDLNRAEQFLMKAFKNGDKNLKSKIAPYLAEIYFHKRDLKKVKEMFSLISLPLQPDVLFMKKFWMGEKEWLK